MNAAPRRLAAVLGDDPAAFARFVAVGLAATATYTGAALAGIALGLGPPVASLLAYGIGGVVSYTGHRRLSFRSRRAHREAVPRFLGVAATGYLLAFLVPLLLMEALRCPPVAAVLVNTVVLPVASAVAMRCFVFGDESHPA